MSSSPALSVVVKARIDEPTRDELEAYAASVSRKPSEVVRLAIREYLDTRPSAQEGSRRV